MDASSGDAAGSIDDPVVNAPFARRIVWRVFNESIFPKQITSFVPGGRFAWGTHEAIQIDRQQTLSLSATIRGRIRSRDISVTRAVLESVSANRTYGTPAAAFAVRFAVWSLAWLATFAGAWLTLGSIFWVYFACLVVSCCASPFAGKAIVDFAWWGGRGFSNESRSQWLITGVLLVLDALLLVALQMHVIQAAHPANLG